MPRKKKEPVKSLPLTPTGKMVILIEMAEADGPIEFRVDDVDVVLSVMQLLINEIGPTMPVDSYAKKEEKRLAEYVRGE